MYYLFTVPVFFFQCFIFATIFLAAKMGRPWFLIVTLFWTGFTLFGSIYTMGLLLFQLFTIAFSYKMGERVLNNLPMFSNPPSPPPVSALAPPAVPLPIVPPPIPSASVVEGHQASSETKA